MPTADTKDKPIKLNTTAYCLLGLIELKPQSAYDLTKFLERSMLKYSLPRTPSQLYNEPKKLAKLGLVSTETETRQGRERTEYHITPMGRELLSEWLSQPGEAAKLEFKSLLKFYLTGASDPQALRDRIEEIKQQNLQEIRDVHAQISRFTAKGVILKEVAINAALTSRFAVGQIKARLQWVEEMQALLAELPDEEDPESWAIEVYRQSQEDLKGLMDEYQLD
ncbi:hypothetical protein R50073_13080 [Maricurvus nonylphenolicus]|uniref:PadR family transcriptional regulator n=1 Tax=Maricurvus nonylphenolicus TaxID=1008307 RepID=UPI0036F22FDB